MKITYEKIKKNIEVYNEARDIFPVIKQFEDSEVDYNTITSLGLSNFGAFYVFLKKNETLGFTPIMDMGNFRKLKPIIIDNTTTERFKSFLKNKTQKKFNEILLNKELFDRLINGAWKSKPRVRRNGVTGYGTRKNEKIEGFKTAILPIINYIILNDLDIDNNILDQYAISDDVKWYTDTILNYDNVQQKEIELTNRLLQTFSKVVKDEKIDFRKLNVDYILSGISNKIKSAMDIPNGKILKCIKDCEKNGVRVLTKDKSYEVKGNYRRNGFLTVYIYSDTGRGDYYEFSYFEDIQSKRDDLLDLLLG
jgi:hypothetical protein